eukprot:TRINITY_DN40756_c0_g1_i1.p2 TRINITY_DN40756_c0_g1~~TRINITY_DN40756_c0_g1_i1.p2  ORF type:complete len:141 (-),score=39.09 TRINITY_DN40756_c0_g1_i1:42-422(-)
MLRSLVGSEMCIRDRSTVAMSAAREWNLFAQGWKAAGLFQVGCSTVVGGLVGMTVAFVVICALVEISISSLEAGMFGAALLAMGAFMMWRSMASAEIQPPALYRAIVGCVGSVSYTHLTLPPQRRV